MSFAEWYAAEPIFLICALISSIVFSIMLGMTVFGGSSGASDIDLDLTEHFSTDAAFKFFSIQSVLAFFMGFGWTGLSARLEFGLANLFAIPLAIVVGLGFMLFTSWLLAKVYSFKHEPKKTLNPAIGAFGKVYLSIPAKGAGSGQVQVTIDGQNRTVNAVSTDAPIKEFSEVEIVGLDDESTLIVRAKLN